MITHVSLSEARGVDCPGGRLSWHLETHHKWWATRRLALSIELIMTAILITVGCERAVCQNTADSTESPPSITSASEALSRVYDYTGLQGLRSIPLSAAAEMATLGTVESDSTPFLGPKNRGKQVWKVSMENVSVQLQTWSAHALRTQVPKDYEFWIDPVNGNLLRATARSDSVQADLPPEPPTDTAAAQLRFVGEVYEGYPEFPPAITLQQAFEKAGLSNPLRAKEVIAVYVMWSYRGRPARPVWCITGRGVPMLKSRPGVPKESGRMRSIVDAMSGDLIRASTAPDLNWENWKGFKK